jgi:hypothetical protein
MDLQKSSNNAYNGQREQEIRSFAFEGLNGPFKIINENNEAF